MTNSLTSILIPVSPLFADTLSRRADGESLVLEIPGVLNPHIVQRKQKYDGEAIYLFLFEEKPVVARLVSLDEEYYTVLKTDDYHITNKLAKAQVTILGRLTKE